MGAGWDSSDTPPTALRSTPCRSFPLCWFSTSSPQAWKPMQGLAPWAEKGQSRAQGRVSPAAQGAQARSGPRGQSDRSVVEEPGRPQRQGGWRVRAHSWTAGHGGVGGVGHQTTGAQGRGPSLWVREALGTTVRPRGRDSHATPDRNTKAHKEGTLGEGQRVPFGVTRTRACWAGKQSPG